MPKPLGRVRVNFIFYETPRELIALLRDIHVAHLDEDGDASQIVLAVPDQMRGLMKWSKTMVPVPEIHGDVLVFKPPVM